MAINKPTGKTPEDIIYDEIDDFNRVSFSKKAEQQLVNCIKEGEGANNPVIIKTQIEKYEESFRTYYYTSQVMTDTKSNDFFEEALKEIHPSVKLKTPAKNILRLVSKVFIQELAETCFQVMSKTNTQDVDQEVVQDSYRLMERRRAKKNSFGKLFNNLH